MSLCIVRYLVEHRLSQGCYDWLFGRLNGGLHSDANLICLLLLLGEETPPELSFVPTFISARCYTSFLFAD